MRHSHGVHANAGLASLRFDVVPGRLLATVGGVLMAQPRVVALGLMIQDACVPALRCGAEYSVFQALYWCKHCLPATARMVWPPILAAWKDVVAPA